MSTYRLVMIGSMLLFGCDAVAISAEPVDLFNGKDLSGWKQRGGQAKYAIEEGAIVGRSVPNTSNTFLTTEREYGDFELELDFKIDDPKFNSGVQIRSHARPQGDGEIVYGYQVEIDPRPDRLWTAGLYFEAGSDQRKAGWLNDLSKNEAAQKAFKLGEWNHLRIVAKGNHIQTWLNGVSAADFTDTDEAAAVPSGFIALQVHSVGGVEEPKEIRWRNIKLTELGSESADDDTSAEGASKKKTGLQLFSRAVVAMFGLDRFSARNAEGFEQLIGKPAPDFTLATPAGESVKLSDLRGKVVLLDFWASWCGPCKLAMPEVEKIHLEFAGKPVQVMGVNLGDDVEAITEVLTAKGVTFSQVMDQDGTVAAAFGASGIPHTVLIDEAGIIQLIHQGYSPSMAEALGSDIKKLLRGESLVKSDVAKPSTVTSTD